MCGSLLAMDLGAAQRSLHRPWQIVWAPGFLGFLGLGAQGTGRVLVTCCGGKGGHVLLNVAETLRSRHLWDRTISWCANMYFLFLRGNTGLRME